MTTRNTPWTPGTPCWVDLMTNDLDAAKLFYTELLGWDLEVGGPEVGGYTTARYQDRRVAGLMSMQPGMQHPSVWSTYFATADITASINKITAAGGNIVMGPEKINNIGSMAFGQDSAGGAFGLWESDQMTGFELANVSRAVTWDELMTRDYPAAFFFYD